MQLKHVVINETDGGRLWEQPQQTPSSISMELMSLWDWDGVLYSMASHCCFQQTVYHYSVWQESKHCAFTGQEKATPPSLCQVPSSCILMLLCFLSHFHTSPCIFLLFHHLCSFLCSHQQHWRAGVHLTHALVTKQVFQLRGRRQIFFVSMSSSLQSGSVRPDFFPPRWAQKECSVLFFYNLFRKVL